MSECSNTLAYRGDYALKELGCIHKTSFHTRLERLEGKSSLAYWAFHKLRRKWSAVNTVQGPLSISWCVTFIFLFIMPRRKRASFATSMFTYVCPHNFYGVWLIIILCTHCQVPTRGLRIPLANEPGAKQGKLKGEVSLYSWPPVWLVWMSLFCK